MSDGIAPCNHTVSVFVPDTVVLCNVNRYNIELVLAIYNSVVHTIIINVVSYQSAFHIQPRNTIKSVPFTRIDVVPINYFVICIIASMADII